jgi:hypothetical protein
MCRLEPQINFLRNRAHLNGTPALSDIRRRLYRVHQTLQVTPAMEAGIAGHVWDVKDLVALLPAVESKPRGSYKKK